MVTCAMEEMTVWNSSGDSRILPGRQAFSPVINAASTGCGDVSSHYFSTITLL